ncbi:MAG: prephenate dehydratase [Cyclobacteriaceae bacterium]|nr:prephenate dehydratase [Cyclobacteriaceae bacterium]MCX7638195.1 prephenate dehydratase [Cyclobacteriaceae bacterium]MDW8330016.1 prephenate dehydratase [Cyclobacteriaceae bacterium]
MNRTDKKANGKLKVAIQGIAGSFHDAAARRYFGNHILPVECLTFQEVFENLKTGRADKAVVAIENSIAGSILPNYTLLQRYRFRISGELYLPIHFHLMALRGVKLKDIRVVESHPMALAQCTDYLHRLNGIQIRESDDTALAAKHIRDKKLRSTAALAAEAAAQHYGLQILARNVETHHKNFTRFLILEQESAEKPRANKASICFEVANRPGSLADVLMVLKSNNINLTKIQSVPLIGRPQEYTIHVDVEWSQRRQYENALRQVIRRVHNLSILGEYEKGKIEYT